MTLATTRARRTRASTSETSPIFTVALALALALDLERQAEDEPAPFPVATSANEYDGRLSPDGRLTAHVSDETGRDEVWTASFPDGRTGSESLATVARVRGSAPTGESSSA